MEHQEEISRELHQKLVGETVKVLIDENNDGELIGRTQWDSPEVDPQVIVSASEKSKEIKPGDFVDVKIASADAYELYGRI